MRASVITIRSGQRPRVMRASPQAAGVGGARGVGQGLPPAGSSR
jgi:hypothetical protein